MEAQNQAVHIVLVHGACHGAWSWYMLKPLLEAAGHRVTAIDMAASGVDPRSLHELRSLAGYTQPLLELMAAIPAEEKVVLVGHSLGGLNIALAMDAYPQKVRVAVFLAAFMPDFEHRPSYVLDEYCERTPAEEWLDTEFLPYGTPQENLTSMFFGPKFLSSKLYQLCSPQDLALAKMLIRPSSLFEDLSRKSPFSKQGFGSVKRVYVVCPEDKGIPDLALAKMLIRPSSLFIEDLSKKSPFSKKGFGSVKRAYVVCPEDKGIPVNFQRWQIEAIGVAQVKEIENADHMSMLSKPEQLSQCLIEIASNYI